ncbi:hypothetical protein [Neorhizobium galegae]|uniref:hypothetical protein n=1 Tax=Neorhizobium galegae TaxID=399 RepID=UPI00351DA56B
MVGYPQEIKGQGIYAYVTLIDGRAASDDLRKELVSGCAGRSAPSPRPTRSSLHSACQRQPRGKSSAESCARSAEDI